MNYGQMGDRRQKRDTETSLTKGPDLTQFVSRVLQKIENISSFKGTKNDGISL